MGNIIALMYEGKVYKVRDREAKSTIQKGRKGQDF
jgi:hypothetical protein